MFCVVAFYLVNGLVDLRNAKQMGYGEVDFPLPVLEICLPSTSYIGIILVLAKSIGILLLWQTECKGRNNHRQSSIMKNLFVYSSSCWSPGEMCDPIFAQAMMCGSFSGPVEQVCFTPSRFIERPPGPLFL